MNELFQNVNGQLVPRDICARKHGGNEQSKAAFTQIYPDLSDAQFKVFVEIKVTRDYGLTVDQISERMNTTPNAVSGRVTELRIKGKIVKKGTRKTRSGCSASVWVAI